MPEQLNKQEILKIFAQTFGHDQQDYMVKVAHAIIQRYLELKQNEDLPQAS